MKILTILAVAILSPFCKQQKESGVEKETAASTITDQSAWQSPTSIFDNEFIDTRLEYADSSGHKLIIENSLPKGGLTYTSTFGKEYVYTIFWTRITNQTSHTFSFSMNFPTDPIKIKSPGNNSVRILIPSDKMTDVKEPLFNYGLDVEGFLDNNLHKSKSLQQTIAPKKICTLYLVTLFDKGLESRVRAGLRIEERELYYKINDLQLSCGHINLPVIKIK